MSNKEDMAIVGSFSMPEPPRYKVFVEEGAEHSEPYFCLQHMTEGNKGFYIIAIQIKDFKVKFIAGKKIKLTKDAFKQLIDFLKANDDDQIHEQKYWQTLIIEWNKNNPERKLPKDYPLSKANHFIQ